MHSTHTDGHNEHVFDCENSKHSPTQCPLLLKQFPEYRRPMAKWNDIDDDGDDDGVVYVFSDGHILMDSVVVCHDS